MAALGNVPKKLHPEMMTLEQVLDYERTTVNAARVAARRVFEQEFSFERSERMAIAFADEPVVHSLDRLLEFSDAHNELNIQLARVRAVEHLTRIATPNDESIELHAIQTELEVAHARLNFELNAVFIISDTRTQLAASIAKLVPCNQVYVSSSKNLVFSQEVFNTALNNRKAKRKELRQALSNELAAVHTAYSAVERIQSDEHVEIKGYDTLSSIFKTTSATTRITRAAEFEYKHADLVFKKQVAIEYITQEGLSKKIANARADAWESPSDTELKLLRAEINEVRYALDDALDNAFEASE